jgi:hypothetical protein
MNLKFVRAAMGVIIATACVGVATVRADTVLDLTVRGSDAWDGSVYFAQASPQPTGTGVIQSFVRIEEKNHEQGYNTDYRYPPHKTQFDENTDPNFTRSLALSSLVPVMLPGSDTKYYRFLLDINEPDASTKKYLSLDKIELFMTNDGSIHDYTLDPSSTGQVGMNTDTFASSPSVMIYNLDNGGDKRIELDYDLNNGSGSGDMFMYVPVSKFDTGYSNVVLYSFFGIPNISESGFEEWATVDSPAAVPVPTAAVRGLALLGGLGVRRWIRS